MRGLRDALYRYRRMIGDHDPEDAYDASDPPAMCLAVLERVVADLEADPAEPRREFRILDALRLVRVLGRRDGLDPHGLAAVRSTLEAL